MITNLTTFQGTGLISPMKSTANKIHAHCAYGGEQFTEKHRATAEHVKPDSQGGQDDDSNFLPVCQKHNNDRGTKPLSEFRLTDSYLQKNIEDSILELSSIKNEEFDGPTWAKQIKKTVEQEIGLELNIDETGTHRTKETPTLFTRVRNKKKKQTEPPAHSTHKNQSNKLNINA